jgi:uncharacterized protein
MEVPAIALAIALAGVAQFATARVTAGGALALGGSGGFSAQPSRMGAVISDAFASPSILLLGGGLAIGALSGADGIAKVKPLFADLFQGMLCLFLLELGRMAAERIGDFRRVGARLAVFALAMPIVHAALGVLVARAAGLSEGGAVVMATLAASASYIAAPAAVRLALPEANPSYYLTCSIGITFPFNIVVGLPLYAAMAAWAYA